jgi:regulator of replication initiation timing
METNFDEFSYYLDNYKNLFVAEGISPTDQNKNLLENAITKINATFNELMVEKHRLKRENRRLRKEILYKNNIIKKTKKKHKVLEGESTRLINSDRGAVKQNLNFARVFKNKRIKLFLKVCLIALILFFLYINDDIVQAIRSKISKKPQ